MVGKEEVRIANFQDVLDSLATLGYKSADADTILLPKIVEVSPAVTSDNQVAQAESGSTTSQQIVVQKPTESLALAINHNALAPVDENDFMPAVSLWTRLGGMFLVGSVGIAIALAAFTPYRVTVKAKSTIRPDGKIKIVQAETSGTIVSVQVKENQAIEKGDIIATIDNSALETEVNLLQNQIQQGKLQQQQLSAQTSAIERQILAEQERINDGVAEAELEPKSNSPRPSRSPNY